MNIKISNGDLLRSEVDAIVNTVNCVGIMGKGIALQFKQKWPENFQAYQRACKAGEVKVGKMFIFDAGGLTQPRYIINFPTKKHWRSKSRIEYIDAGLDDLVASIQKLGIKSIALPPLGCGNGGLDWNIVRNRIERAFSGLHDVRVLLFEPKGSPAPQSMVNRTKCPTMTPARAAIVKIISIYREMQYGLGKIEIQKLAYFLEQAGEPLNLEFEKNQFGPYSSKLRHVLKAMDGHYIVGVGDNAGESEIVLTADALAAAESFLSSCDNTTTTDRISRVRKLIEGFETPYGMELLATVHWVLGSNRGISSVDDLVKQVHAWSEHKRRSLQPGHIAIAMNRLQELGW